MSLGRREAPEPEDLYDVAKLVEDKKKAVSRLIEEYKTIEERVYYLLVNFEETRRSDKNLLIRYLENFCNLMIIDIPDYERMKSSIFMHINELLNNHEIVKMLTVSLGKFMDRQFKALRVFEQDLPVFESVTRCRRRIQEEARLKKVHEIVLPHPVIQDQRDRAEKDLREYFGSRKDE